MFSPLEVLVERLFYIVMILFLIFGAYSCSSSEITSPTMTEPDFTSVGENSLPVAVSDWSADGKPLGGTGVLGLFHIEIDAENLTGEIIPFRKSSLVDVVEVLDITAYLAVSPCTHCVKLESIGKTESNELVVNIAIKHPIPMGNPAEEITGSNRADLIVYNVEGIILTDGTATFGAMGEVVPMTCLVNADGYTGYLDESLDPIYNTTSTIHPYILHFDNYEAGNYDPLANPGTGFPLPPVMPEGNLVMGHGADFNSQEYIFDLGINTTIHLAYVVGCTYGLTTSDKSERFTPESRVPQHNKKAASEVKVEVVANGLTGYEPTSVAVLHISVLDMNHGVPVGIAFNQMLAQSDVDQISIFVPHVTAEQVVVNNPAPLSGDPRDPENPLLYEIVFSNSAYAHAGNYFGLCKILDSYSPSQNPTLIGMDGIKRVGPEDSPIEGLFAIDEFATYQVFEVSVDVGVPPIMRYEPDPSRTSINVSDPTLSHPVDPEGELDIGVCENPLIYDVDGIYMFDQDQQVCRFDYYYSDSSFQAPGLLPSNDTGTHPDPDEPMQGYRLDVAENGYLITSYLDMNETMDLSTIDPFFNDPFPEGDVWAHWKPAIPRPISYPPYPHNILLIQACVDSEPDPGEPLENPVAHEGWDESNFVTVSTPAYGDPNGSDPYQQIEDVLSVMYRYTNPIFSDPSTGYAMVYYGHFPPYYDRDTGSFFSLYSYAWEYFGVSADEIVGVDRSDKDWLYICTDGFVSAATWDSGSTENLFLIDANQPNSPGWLLDINTSFGLTTEKVLDVECIPFDPDNPIIFDDGSGGENFQISAIGAILYSHSHVYLIGFDSTPGNEAFILYQDINGTEAIIGTPRHLDVGETTLDIHVTSTDGVNAYATVFKLSEQ